MSNTVNDVDQADELVAKLQQAVHGARALPGGGWQCFTQRPGTANNHAEGDDMTTTKKTAVNAPAKPTGRPTLCFARLAGL